MCQEKEEIDLIQSKPIALPDTILSYPSRIKERKKTPLTSLLGGTDEDVIHYPVLVGLHDGTEIPLGKAN